jgi:hypothetical protein
MPDLIKWYHPEPALSLEEAKTLLLPEKIGSSL